MDFSSRLNLPFSRRTLFWLVASVAFLSLGVGVYVYRSLIGPKTLQVVVAQNSEDADIMRAFARALDEAGAPVRLDVTQVADVIEAGRTLNAGKTDIAVVRPDLTETGEALGVTPLRKSTLLVFSLGDKIESFDKLAGKRLALALRGPGDQAVLDRVLARYDLTAQVKVFAVADSDAAKLIASKQVEALAILAPPLGRETRRLLRDVSGRKLALLKPLDIDDAESLSEVAPAYSEETVKAGSLAAHPKLPAEDMTTVGVSYYLMAQRKVSRETIATLTELLFKERQKIARSAPAINQMKGLDPDEAPKSGIPTHPGAIDYFAREQRSFLDVYGDWLWLGLFAAGGVSSFFTWLWSFYARRRRDAVHDILERLGRMLKEARTSSEDQLESLELQLDDVVRDVIRHTTEERTNTRTMSALMLAIESTRAAIGERLYLVRK